MFPSWVLLVCLLVGNATSEERAHSLTDLPQNNEPGLCFGFFSGVDPMTSQHWAGGEGLGFCLCSPLWGMCRGAAEGP